MNVNLAKLHGKYRLITRSDFDGLVCGMLLTELNLIDDIKFVHPKDMQDGIIEVTDRDITTNLPYVPGCAMAFDHHDSEMLRNLGVEPAPTKPEAFEAYIRDETKKWARVIKQANIKID